MCIRDRTSLTTCFYSNSLLCSDISECIQVVTNFLDFCSKFFPLLLDMFFPPHLIIHIAMPNLAEIKCWTICKFIKIDNYNFFFVMKSVWVEFAPFSLIATFLFLFQLWIFSSTLLLLPVASNVMSQANVATFIP